jgi:PAS domain S-box-containing protein
MLEFFKNLLSSAGFDPHGHCYLWRPEILWLHVVSDAFISLAYYSIPVALIYFVHKRRDIAYRWMFVMFGIFIFFCGTTHVMAIWTVWNGTYRLDGIIKLLTAGVSVTTAALLWPVIPAAVALPGPTQLEQANSELQNQIAERQRAEEALHASQQMFFRLFEFAPEAIVVVDAAGRIARANAQMEQLFGYSREEVVGQTIEVLIPERFAMQHIEHRTAYFAEPRTRPVGVGLELYGRRKDGSEFPVDIMLSPLEADEGLMALAVVRDITARKLAEEQAREAFRSGVLLREIHHRVKNNLQVISSLLFLPSLYTSDPNTLRILRASQDRVRSIALIHERLYQSRDLETIDFAAYVNQLTTDLFCTYDVPQEDVALKVNIEGVSLDIDTAIPCGLIISELVANVLTHAFPGGRKGEVGVTLLPPVNGQYTLTVCDSGVGLPEDFDLESPKSLGLQLVIDLTSQLRGTIKMDPSAGTCFTIAFTTLPYQERQ